jgi:hypothetical protein
MLAYTAWDSLQTIARQYDADLNILAADQIASAPEPSNPRLDDLAQRANPRV